MKGFIIVLASLVPLVAISQSNPENESWKMNGRVVGHNQAGLVAATIIIKGTSTGTVTDSLGEFSLKVNHKYPFNLLVSFAGYENEIVVIKNSSVNNFTVKLRPLFQVDTILITSRRRREILQDVPIPITVVGGKLVDDAGAFNVNRVKELVPSVQLYTSNPRNTGINIRGLGSPFGLTNDGLDPGVGYYVDGVYYARPAAATLDFVDIDQIEVLRGPQGTLFGKNTTSGAINITTRRPSFKPGANFEVSYGNYGFVQAKSSISGAISKKLAARLSFSGTQRDGLIENVRTTKFVNDVNNLGFRGQLLYEFSANTSVLLAADANRQNPDGYAQVVAGVVKTKRPAYRQFDSIIKDLNYSLPSLNAFDRKIDHDVPWNSGNEIGGVSVNVDSKLGSGSLTSTTAWRYWNWDPSNDRDFTGLQALSKSQNPAEHRNWSQEIRYAGKVGSQMTGIAGLFYISQIVRINGTEESGSDQWRFSQSSNSISWQTPGLFEGYGIHTQASIASQSAAAFANIDWEIFEGLHVQPGLRYNYDKKGVVYDRVAYGGLETSDPALLSLKNAVYSSQFYKSDAEENNFTYQFTLSYRTNKRFNTFASYSTSFKPVGVNVAGLPTIAGKAATNLAVIKPEYLRNFQVGFKTLPIENFTLNLTLHHTDIKNYQTNVQSPELGVNRGYIANVDKVNVKGFELDANIKLAQHLNFYGATAFTDAKYVKFTNAPLPLEETGVSVNGVQVAFKDISGGNLPGVSKWATSLGGEFTTPAAFGGKAGKFFIALEGFYRSKFSSSPSPSAYLNIDGYTLVNSRFGFRTTNGLSAFVWTRNLLNKDYFEQLLPAGGNAGHYAAVLGDQRTGGITLRYTF